MLYGELLSSPSTVLGSNDNFDEFIKYVSYLKQHTKNQVESMPLDDIEGLVFKDGKLFIESVNKNSINKSVMEKCGKIQIEEVSEDMLEALRRMSASRRTDRRNAIKADMDSCLRNAINRNRESLSYFSDASKYALKLKEFDGVDDNFIADHIVKINSEGFWKYIGTSPHNPDSIVFITRNQVTLEFNDMAVDEDDDPDDEDAQKFMVSKKLPMGYFKLVINIVDSGIDPIISGIQDNLRISPYIHPHVDSRGAICLGNTATAMKEAYSKYDLSTIAKLISMILMTYNPDSPYVNFSEFERLYKTKQMMILANKNHAQLLDYFSEVLYDSEDIEDTVSTDGVASLTNTLTNRVQTPIDIPF